MSGERCVWGRIIMADTMFCSLRHAAAAADPMAACGPISLSRLFKMETKVPGAWGAILAISTVATEQEEGTKCITALLNVTVKQLLYRGTKIKIYVTNTWQTRIIHQSQADLQYVHICIS